MALLSLQSGPYPDRDSQVSSAGSSGKARVAPKTLRFWGQLCLVTATPSFSLTTGGVGWRWEYLSSRKLVQERLVAWIKSVAC